MTALAPLSHCDWASSHADRGAPSSSSRSLIRASYLCHPLRHLIDLICFVADGTLTWLLLRPRVRHPIHRRADVIWVIPIRSGNSCRISHAMSSLSSQNSNPSKALLRSFSLLTSFINFSYIFFKLMISWFWKKCYKHTSLYCIYKNKKLFLRGSNLCVTSYYLSYFLIFRRSLWWSFDLGYLVGL